MFNALSRDRMEQYVFSLTDDTFFRLVQQRTENSGLPQERVEEIAALAKTWSQFNREENPALTMGQEEAEALKKN